MGVDIEVHDWLEGPEKFPPWVQTTFGHRVRINIPTLSYQRVTQLGWSIYEDDGEGGQLVKTTERCMLCPTGSFTTRRRNSSYPMAKSMSASLSRFTERSCVSKMAKFLLSAMFGVQKMSGAPQKIV